MPSTITHTGVRTGLVIVVLVSWTSGLITETTSSNKPPFSFSCAPISLSDSVAVCGSIPEKPFVRIEKVVVHKDISSTTYDECLDPEKAVLAEELSEWFNVECKKALNDRLEETYRVPLSYLNQAIEEHCHVTPSIITKIVVEYECARTLQETVNIPAVQARSPSISTTRSRAIYTTKSAVAGVGSGTVIPGRATSTKANLNSIGLTADESTLLIVLLPTAIVILIAIIGILWFCCCQRKRGLEEQRKTSIASGLNVARQSAIFLVPASNESGGQDNITGELFTAVPAYEGLAAVTANEDAAEFAFKSQKHFFADAGRRSVSIAAVDGTDGQRRASLVSRQQQAESSVLPINAYIVDATPEVLMATQMGSRRSSIIVDRPSAGIVYDQRRRQSTNSASSSDVLRRISIDENGRSGSLSAAAASGTVVENRKLSRTSYAELPSSDRRSSGSSVHFSGGADQTQRRVSLALPASDERRLSDGGGGGGGSRRATATGLPGMPGIDELHEAGASSAVTASAIAAAAAAASAERGNSQGGRVEEGVLYRGGSRALSLDGGAAPATPASATEGQQQFRRIYGRQSWSGAANDEAATPLSEANYFYWPTE